MTRSSSSTKTSGWVPWAILRQGPHGPQASSSAPLAAGRPLAVGRLGQQPGRRPLPHPLRPAQQVGVVEPAAAQRGPEGADRAILRLELGEGHRAAEDITGAGRPGRRTAREWTARGPGLRFPAWSPPHEHHPPRHHPEVLPPRPSAASTREEVAAFLALVANEFEGLVKELNTLREDNRRKSDELIEHRGRERSLQETLVAAQRASEEIRESARKEAEITVADAELQAEKIVQGAHQRFLRIVDDINELKRQRVQFEAGLKSLAEGTCGCSRPSASRPRRTRRSRSPPAARSWATTRLDRPRARGLDGAQCASAQLRPCPTSTSSGTARLAAALHLAPQQRRAPAPPPAPPPPPPARRGPGAACGRRAAPRPAPPCTRSMASLTMSAAVPWIGVLTAIRSAAWRSAGLRAAISGRARRRPKSVRTSPVRRASATIASSQRFTPA